MAQIQNTTRTRVAAGFDTTVLTMLTLHEQDYQIGCPPTEQIVEPPASHTSNIRTRTSSSMEEADRRSSTAIICNINHDHHDSATGRGRSRYTQHSNLEEDEPRFGRRTRMPQPNHGSSSYYNYGGPTSSVPAGGHQLQHMSQHVVVGSSSLGTNVEPQPLSPTTAAASLGTPRRELTQDEWMALRTGFHRGNDRVPPTTKGARPPAPSSAVGGGGLLPESSNSLPEGPPAHGRGPQRSGSQHRQQQLHY
ncbi:unnamed protein product, partial [Amoebophrya sp. A25]|eukprot:GSA25T00027276001.1